MSSRIWTILPRWAVEFCTLFLKFGKIVPEKLSVVMVGAKFFCRHIFFLTPATISWLESLTALYALTGKRRHCSPSYYTAHWRSACLTARMLSWAWRQRAWTVTWDTSAVAAASSKLCMDCPQRHLTFDTGRQLIHSLLLLWVRLWQRDTKFISIIFQNENFCLAFYALTVSCWELC